MKVGSLVECVHRFHARRGTAEAGIIKTPTVGKIYTVRDLPGDEDIRLEEIVNPKICYDDGYAEVSFAMEGFRELQPPMSISIEEFTRAEV